MKSASPPMQDATGRTLLHHEVIAENADAPWLVFIHGAGGSIRTWKFQIEAFAPHYRLLLIDLRDHGLSKDILPEFPAYDFGIVAEDILAVIDHLAIQKANFISLSIGSVILQKLDIERPKLIDRMVMAGAIFDGSTLMHWFVHSAKLLAHVLPYRAMYWLFSFIVMPRRNHRLSRYIFRLQSKRLSSNEYLKWVELYKPFFSLIRYYVDRPVMKKGLVVMGSQDHIFFRAAERFARLQKNMRLTVIENCGHVCSIEAPEVFNELVLKFLQGQDIPNSVVSDPAPQSWSELKALQGG
ncbi:MAG: alpha/beta fold hydrolase [Flavobacteriales bacterium]|nr:alpha/beta fold hydrolase [Flavobacteriales bacterium]